MQNKNFDYIFKILLLGDSRVGKTCLSKRFLDNYFTDYYSTTYGKKLITIYIINYIYNLYI